ncbi:serine hydrolase domain-containing protein [Inhella proteolytica]|uniref:Beta-lactamase family protein n=1 Tax=Inhella proteolytica TaxID=2795029 RepID=A0A931NHT6_9BURK|nr:serine hydrolase domain-containing protein [Inhella proteolytica]MBH9576860.1 beta-lactamase family protein [Inhella proteolytica]
MPALILLLCALLALPVHADSLRQRIESFIAEKRTPGLVLMVVQQGQVLRHEAFGLADLETKRPLQRDAILRLYSMSKPLTALAVLRQVQAGRLRLDTPLQELLPQFAKLPTIQIRHLLSHTAGFDYGGDLTSWTGLRYLWAQPMDQEGKSLEQAMAALAGLPLRHEPGQAWTYGMSSDVLGAVLERLHGQPLDQVLAREVFAPLGMVDTGFQVPAAQRPRLATQHEMGGIPLLYKRIRVDADSSRLGLEAPRLRSAGGGLVGTVADYMRFAQALLQRPPKLLAPALFEAMLSNQLPAAQPRLPAEVYARSGYGLGLGIKLEDDGPQAAGTVFWAGKGGSLFWVDRQHQLAVVAAMPLNGAARGLEKRLIPWVYEWLAQRGR